MRHFKLLVKLLVLLLMAAAMPMVARAQAPSAGIPHFMPTESWQVQPTALAQARGLSKIKLPCMMASQYDNGYIVRLSGGAGNFLAMAVDFRQSVFHQGRKYNARINFDGASTQQTKATAFSESVLIFNLRNLSGFYQALQNASSMGLEVEGNAMAFSLGSFEEGADRLEACYNPSFKGATPPTPRKNTVQNIGQNTTMSKWDEEVTPTPAPRLSRGLRSTKSPSSMLWEAKAGDDLKRTLQGWAARAGVELSWQANQGGRVANDIRVSGTFEEAVQNLMAQNAAAMGLEANLMGNGTRGASAATSAPQRIVPISSAPSAVAKPAGKLAGGQQAGNARWFAPAGSSLQQTLQIWSKQAGVEMEWQSNEGFAVKRAVSANGSYESALQSLLGQYTGDKVRPAAQLNNDPITGRRFLFIQSTRVL